jgi:hypothetical protein
VQLEARPDGALLILRSPVRRHGDGGDVAAVAAQGPEQRRRVSAASRSLRSSTRCSSGTTTPAGGISSVLSEQPHVRHISGAS